MSVNIWEGPKANRLIEAVEALEEIGRPTQAQTDIAVNEWLDNHPEATTTVDFSIVTKVFGTVAAMASDTTLASGDNVATKGYYASGDNGGANYVVSASHTGVFYITLANGLYANRLSEAGIVQAESVGIKAYSSSTDDPNSDDMDRNVSLFNAAIQAGIILIFGRGHFYFSSEIDLTPYTYEIYGISDNLAYLHFPSSVGLSFSNAAYHKDYVIENLSIDSYSHCIFVSETCYTVMESRFQNLTLVSETGDGIHGPNYNKNANQYGNYDTVVQDAIIRHVNVTAKVGAGFANMFGHGGYYEHINFIECKYGFLNCDGHVKQTNNLGTQQMEYFAYYDKCNNYGLRWVWDRVNAEALSKAVIGCTARTLPGTGEDPDKPTNANFFTIQEFIVIDSHWDLRNVTAGSHQEYPFTVQSINNVQLIGCPAFISSDAAAEGQLGQYPSLYDTSVVKGQMRSLVDRYFYTYLGGYTFTFVWGNNNTITTQKGIDRMTQINKNVIPYETYYLTFMNEYDMLHVHNLFGGKAMDMYKVNTSQATVTNSQLNISDQHAFFDILVLVVDSVTDYVLHAFSGANNRLLYPGRIVTLVNDPTSQANILFDGITETGFRPYGLAMSSRQTILPGQCMHLMLTYHTNTDTNARYLAWRPIFTDTWGS